MSEVIKVGLLPLYIELYDRVVPQARKTQEEFASQIASRLAACELEVVSAPVCRVKTEFAAAIAQFREAGCDVLATLHLAYSPSLESIEAIMNSDLPVVMLDTTPDGAFPNAEGLPIMANHGIHGVQDLGNLLLRNRKPFLIAAGAWQDAAYFERCCRKLKAAAMAAGMNHLRIGSVGKPFNGMGDFRVEGGFPGIQEVKWANRPEPTGADVEKEMALDRENFEFVGVDAASHRDTVRASLKLRAWIEEEKLDGFTISFPDITRKEGWDTVPFLECSKAMARGISYAGEGDLLTAGLYAALLRGFPECGFSEMFCPDWAGNRIFTSHMGEINLALAGAKPLLTSLDYVYSDTGNPAVAYCCYKPGRAMWVNLAPGADGRFTLIAAPVEFLPPPEGTGKLPVNAGWFKPAGKTIAEFLEAFTEAGGTHHSVVVYDGNAEILSDFAKLMNWKFVEI